MTLPLFMLIYIGHVTLCMKARLKHIIYYKFVQKNSYHAKLAHLSQLDILHRLVPLCSVTRPHTWKRGWIAKHAKGEHIIQDNNVDSL